MQLKKVISRFFTIMLSLFMMLGLIPAYAFADEPEFGSAKVQNETSNYAKDGIAAIADDVWTNHTASDFNGGGGSATNPYKIANAEQLALLASNVNNRNDYANAYFQLEDNIDLSAYRWSPIGTYKWETNGNTISRVFSGSFDGNNKTISGLMVDERTDKGVAGLFGFISDNAKSGVEPTVKNLTISNASIYASDNGLEIADSGILAGKASVNDGARITITNVAVSGTITNESAINGGSYRSGGMIGDASRVDFTDCKADRINISGAATTGGFVGMDSDSSFTNCKAVGSISGSWALGGFVGHSQSSNLNAPTVSKYNKCTAEVDVTGTDWRLGGFVGFLQGGQITKSVAYGNVTSDVTDWEPKTGGFAGESSGAIDNSFAEGTVSSAHKTIMPGGFIGHDAGGTTTQCMFDKTINATLSAIGAVGSAGTNDIKEGTTQENKDKICDVILEGHTIDTSVWGSDATQHWNMCSDCGVTSDIASHTFGDWVFDTPATETTAGSKHRDCSVCAYRDIGSIPVLPHTHTPSTTWTKDATNHWYECIANDGEKWDLAPHTFGDWVFDTPATGTTEGSKYRDCAICGQREIAEIPIKEADTVIKDTSSPKTGDNSNLAIYVFLLLLSGCAVGIVIKARLAVSMK